MKILIADDHDIVRRGLKQLLTMHPGWEVCAEARTGREAVVLADHHAVTFRADTDRQPRTCS